MRTISTLDKAPNNLEFMTLMPTEVYGEEYTAIGVICPGMREDKAKAVYDMCYGNVSPQCPASILQLHTNCTVIADEAALSPQEF